MAVKTITITEDAYSRLSVLKEQGESFSEVVTRITAKGSILDLAGVLSDKEASEVKSAITKLRKSMAGRLERVARDFK